MMLRWKPLSSLAHIWAIIVIATVLVSVFLNFKVWRKEFKELWEFIVYHRLFCVSVVLIVLAEIIIIVHSYQFTLDAAYYVSEANTAIETNMMGIYDPYTGMWLDHFEIRYFFQTYPMQDAVMCYWTGLHPLIWTKTVMEAGAIVLTNCVAFLIGKRLFKPNVDRDMEFSAEYVLEYEAMYKRIPVFLFFMGLLHLFFTTIYTSSAFLTTRTYEGKALVGNVVLPMILYIYMKLLEDHKDNRYYALLFLVALGAAVLSNSSNMLVPASILILFVPLFIIRRDKWILIKSFLSMIPGTTLMFIYVAYVKGMFVIYTFPR